MLQATDLYLADLCYEKHNNNDDDNNENNSNYTINIVRMSSRWSGNQHDIKETEKKYRKQTQTATRRMNKTTENDTRSKRGSLMNRGSFLSGAASGAILIPSITHDHPSHAKKKRFSLVQTVRSRCSQRQVVLCLNEKKRRFNLRIGSHTWNGNAARNGGALDSSH